MPSSLQLQMLLPNKIKESELSIESKSAYFKNFIDTLRENRTHFLPLPHKSLALTHNDPHPNDHDQPSESNHSEILQLHRIEKQFESSLSNVSSGGGVRERGEGDRAIRNKLRFGVGNRHRAERFRLPAYCFQQIKEDLDGHLRAVKGEAGRSMLHGEEGRHRRAREEEDFDEMMEQKGISGEDRPRKLSATNPNIALKYCTIHQISNNSPLKDILLFFTRMLEVLNYSIPEPKIEKYKNCVYFGQPIKKNQIYQGIVYYYCGIIYLGELYNNEKHGLGVEIDIERGGVYKGEFRTGEMVGTFEVQKDGEKYVGQLENGLYHGRGKLIDGEGVFEGQFKAGQKIYGSTQRSASISKKKNHSNSRRDRQDPSYWSAEKDMKGSRTEYLQFSKNKIYPANGSLYLQSNTQLSPIPERKRQGRYNDETRDFSYPLNYEFSEQRFNPESEAPSAKKTSKVATMRIREVGKLHSKLPIVQQDEQRPLISKI